MNSIWINYQLRFSISKWSGNVNIFYFTKEKENKITQRVQVKCGLYKPMIAGYKTNQSDHARTSIRCVTFHIFLDCTVNEKSYIVYLLYITVWNEQKKANNLFINIRMYPEIKYLFGWDKTLNLLIITNSNGKLSLKIYMFLQKPWVIQPQLVNKSQIVEESDR